MAIQMTREEHIARAMLLGAIYRTSGRYYFKSGPGENTLRYDADTLEPISSEEARRRIKEWVDNE